MTIYSVPTSPNLAEPITPTKMSKTPCPSSYNAPSPTNAANFSPNGWMTTTRPTKCIVSGRIGQIISYEEYTSKTNMYYAPGLSQQQLYPPQLMMVTSPLEAPNLMRKQDTTAR
jgi:hypothetical protein